jgi:DNA-binding HxlR family transcriptional regulator
LNHLVEIGLLERNPGHGHPLRPEYRLTVIGMSAAAVADRILAAARSQDQALLRRVWTVPILTSLRKPRHFNEIKRSLPMITDRALSQSLKSMEDRDWVQRQVDEAARPPRSLYSAVNIGGEISRATGAEVRFG